MLPGLGSTLKHDIAMISVAANREVMIAPQGAIHHSGTTATSGVVLTSSSPAPLCFPFSPPPFLSSTVGLEDV